MESHLVCHCDPRGPSHRVIDILEKLLNVPAGEPFTPSVYFHEMKMSTEERLEHLCKTRRNITLPGSPFLATPDVIIFQNFVPGVWYNTTLTLQNKETSSRCVRIYFEPSIHFRLTYPSKIVWTKVAPGMTYQLIVSFNGDVMKDYFHHITFITEVEQFTIPLFALRTRPLIDFPDLIKMPDVPVNAISEKNIVLRNHTLVAGTFGIITKEECTACPVKAILAPNEKIFLKLTHKTRTLGVNKSSLMVKFDDGVSLNVVLECNAVPSSIYLEKDCVKFEDTFMALQRQETVTLQYAGVNTGQFKWKKYKDTHCEEIRRAQLKEAFDHVRETETMRCVPLKRYKIIDEDSHGKVYERIFADEVEEVERKEEFLFESSYFTIMPLVTHTRYIGCSIEKAIGCL